MTTTEERLTRSMHGASSDPPSSTDAGWAAVEARVVWRATNRRRAQRSALVAAVLTCTVGATALVRMTGSEPATGGVSASSGDGASAGIERGVPVVIIATALVIAVAVGLVTWATRRRRQRRPHTVTGRSPAAMLATAAILPAVLLPVWALLATTATVDRSIERNSQIPGIEVIALDRTWFPIDTGTELASLRVRPTSPTGRNAESAVIAALLAAGFEERNGSYFLEHAEYDAVGRETGRGDADFGWSDNDDITIVSAEGAGGASAEVTLDLRLPNAHAGDFLPLSVLASSSILSLCALALTLAHSSAGRWLGLAAMALTAAQAALAVRAMIRATDLIEEYRSTVGTLARDDLWVSPSSPAIVDLRTDVHAVATYLYPVTSGALILLAVPWLTSTASVFLGRPKLLFAANIVWGLGALAMLVMFRNESGIVLDILE